MLASAATTAVRWVDRCGSFCPGSIDEAQFAELFDDESQISRQINSVPWRIFWRISRSGVDENSFVN